MKPRHLHSVRPLERLASAEQRIQAPIPRNLNERPFMLGEGPIYWTAERIAGLAADNEARRKRRGK